jgi:nucleotide-binding universal stress UspA family protein
MSHHLDLPSAGGMSEHPVVACYRGLDSADAVELGALLAATLHEPLVLAGAYRYEPVGLSARGLPEPDNARREAATRAALRRARAFAGSDVELREQVVPSLGVADGLTALAVDVDACALVLGRDTEGRVTRSLLPRAPCPVAVAPLSVPLPPVGSLRRIGVAFDGSPAAGLALVGASHLARATGARLVLLSAAPTTEDAAIALDLARQSLGEAPGSPETGVLIGEPTAELTEASGDLDLLACGSRGHSRPLAAILGSVSGHLVAHARCPVLVVPPVVRRSADGPLGTTSAAANA